jgi:GR25 family glycosyltransferase involved in LPS biosynthesis
VSTSALASLDEEPPLVAPSVPDGPKVDGYVINLDSRRENYAHFTRHMSANGLVPNAIRLERISAVDMTGVRLDGRGGRISAEKRRRLKEHVSPRALSTMLRGQRRYHEQFTSGGAVGCYLSHVEFWRKVASLPDNARGALVMEDDARVLQPGSLGALLHSIAEKGLPKDADVLLLGWVNLDSVAEGEAEAGPIRLAPNIVGHRVVRPFGCTHMYFVTPRGARKLLETAFPIEVQVDFYMGQRLDAQLSEVLGIEPLVVYGARTDVGETLVAQHNPTGSSVTHDDCPGCGPFVDRSVPSVAGQSGTVQAMKEVGVMMVCTLLIAIVVVLAVVWTARRAVLMLSGRRGRRAGGAQ